jgi:hypothetical protein
MKITARKDVPCVSQTKEWKGFFEAHFMSGEEIDKKYPILNPLWTLVKVERFDFSRVSYATAYRVKCSSFNGFYSDPWYRQLKHDDSIDDNDSEIIYATTVESNKVLLIFEKT